MGFLLGDASPKAHVGRFPLHVAVRMVLGCDLTDLHNAQQNQSHSIGDRALEWTAQNSCGVSVFGDTQDLPGCFPV